MKEEIKALCMKCEEQIYCQGKACAFRSLGNEYCDYVENANNLINNLQSQLKAKEETINKAIKHVSSLSSKGRGCEIYADVKRDILEILSKGENK